MIGPTTPEARPMQPKGTAPTGLAHNLPDDQAILHNQAITFRWLYNAEVSITMLSGESVRLAPQKFKTSVNIEERAEWSAFEMQTVAHKITFCLPWFGRKLIVTRTRPILDHLVKLGFGI
jgi:hypothetical protein